MRGGSHHPPPLTQRASFETFPLRSLVALYLAKSCIYHQTQKNCRYDLDIRTGRG
jgi:hypothetical protein